MHSDVWSESMRESIVLTLGCLACKSLSLTTNGCATFTKLTVLMLTYYLYTSQSRTLPPSYQLHPFLGTGIWSKEKCYPHGLRSQTALGSMQESATNVRFSSPAMAHVVLEMSVWTFDTVNSTCIQLVHCVFGMNLTAALEFNLDTVNSRNLDGGTKQARLCFSSESLQEAQRQSVFFGVWLSFSTWKKSAFRVGISVELHPPPQPV